ncbi:hypothetical protein FVEG_09635 [Fusarium verticillioides 7600]|uniref:Uncharacterized protein n=1 Tax=Gibberella moniliformis (strain M3125 / FGSC 7600) TaxID=334819 RepID=W7MHU0_GIBM7|nr:hypothetical protein FVEG_09635 [Fusarium verticillioides 7600]EWG50401.1 hypothetical protein FVEG_09635 [Fusarium verticillioides 7600]
MTQEDTAFAVIMSFIQNALLCINRDLFHKTTVLLSSTVVPSLHPTYRKPRTSFWLGVSAVAGVSNYSRSTDYRYQA